MSEKCKDIKGIKFDSIYKCLEQVLVSAYQVTQRFRSGKVNREYNETNPWKDEVVFLHRVLGFYTVRLCKKYEFIKKNMKTMKTKMCTLSLLFFTYQPCKPSWKIRIRSMYR
ncbi:hypothetical protein RF11_08273 [Thelohanellus kitauei]|uniref:Uncharacterized protein n=1 Tax=Thelohanellus kitauei TaxID=669202 RepID=A0A0C2IYS9_THEKT|nr:hypothetical protein RF11_08273 [Thelohanellus kitauei]